MHLNDFQRSYAQHRITFFSDALSLELAESLRRTSLACAENAKEQAGIVDVLCGLYLQDREEISRHFGGDLGTVVSENFPIHRFGRDGLLPQAMIEKSASESGESGFSFFLSYNDDVLRLLWLSRRIANAVGKKPSLTDVVAAVALNPDWMDELSRSGFTPSRELADFDQDVRTIIFYATPHTGKDWPREMDFELDTEFQAPYKLELSTPSGPFQPVWMARVKLNGSEVADVSWPDKPSSTVGVELRTSNKIEFDLDGPMFGSVELKIRGNLPNDTGSAAQSS